MIILGKTCPCNQPKTLISNRRCSSGIQSRIFRSSPQRFQQKLQISAVDYRTLAPPVKFDHSGTADEVRTYLTKLGWERAWIDGITERILKMEFKTSLSQTEQVIQLLEGLGLPTHWVCNLIARVPAILGRDAQTQLQAVLDYVQKRGVTGGALTNLIQDYPRLLLFDVSADGTVLEMGPTRAEVDVIEDPYKGKVSNVSYWRTGATFETAPVSPRKPDTQ